MPEPVISYLRWRVIKTFNAGNAEVTNDLPTLHRAHIEVVAFQPGNPGSSALGSFTIPLHPPGSEGYAAAKVIYDQLDYFQRVEGYISHDGASLGKLYYAGIITGIRKGYGSNSRFELTGNSDILLANLSRPFPAEIIYSTYGGVGSPTDLRIIRNYLGGNEVGASDAFGSSTAGRYTSGNYPGLTSGTWTLTTDDGLAVVTDSTGTGATLISNSGALAGNLRHNQMAEVMGRLQPSTDATNAGKFGIGISKSNANSTQDFVIAYLVAKYVSANANWNLDLITTTYAAGVFGSASTVTNAFTGVGDLEGFIPISISYLASSGIADVVVNGKNVTATLAAETDFGTSAAYPFLFFGTPATGSAAGFFTNLIQMVRYADDQNPGTALFKQGTTATASHSLPFQSDPGPTFLELWSRVATREGWYWRYTPTPYVVGTRTIGSVDFTTDPGTDRGANQSVVFSRPLGNLVGLELSGNADSLAVGTMASSQPSSDGGGLAYWRDVGTITKYGAFEDQALAVTSPNFLEQRRASLNITANKVALNSSGAKTAVVLRDPQTADVWRELDKVMIHDPEIGINYLVARVIGYTFDEGQPTQTLMLDQHGADNPTLLAKRTQTGVWQVASKFNTR